MPAIGFRSEVSKYPIDLAASEAHLAWFEGKSAENLKRKLSFVASDHNDVVQPDNEVLTQSVDVPSARALIAVVDDEPVIAITLAEILIKHGFDAVWFTVASEVLEFFMTCRIDLLLTDITMPTMDGISLAAELKRIHTKCPVFLISGRSQEEDVRRRVRLFGSGVHLESKPLNVMCLVSKIHELLAKGQLPRTCSHADEQ